MNKTKGNTGAAFEVFCDFDGTITTVDTIDVLLEELADPSWREVEASWVAGEIGSRECMALQIPLIRGGWPAVQGCLSKVEMDPFFPAFAAFCRDHGMPLRVVSDGMERVISHILEREGVAVDGIWANRVVEDDDGRLSLAFPHRMEGCPSGVCKCAVIEPARTRTVVVGDGRSDFCWSKGADLVFARGSLLEEFRKEERDCVPFESFQVVLETLRSLVLTTSTAAD